MHSKSAEVLNGNPKLQPAKISISNNNDDGFRIFPNPAKEFVNIYIDLSVLPCSLNLYDINGHLAWNAIVNSGNYNLDVRAFIRGVYMLKISNSHITMYKKIIIEKSC